MDIFTSIDWHPPLSDIIDNEFVNIDRLERESVMYSLLHGTHTDPFKDLYKDNNNLVTEKHLQDIRKQCLEESKIPKKKQKMNNLKVEFDGEPSERPQRSEMQQCSKMNTYIPGIQKKPFHFPRFSNLSAEQQALCLRVILKFSRSEKPAPLTKQEINELQTYMSLKSIINEEQDEYSEMAKQHWDSSKINIIREDLINLKWEEKIKQLDNLHKYYNEAGTIAFNSEQIINVQFNSTVLETGITPFIDLPNSRNRNKINVNSATIKQKYFSGVELNKNNNVNQDINCKDLAKSHDVDLVISSSGLKCLATNLNPRHNNTWILPIVIETHNLKNIIYIDKPLPNAAKNVMDKNTWIYKYILKNHILRLQSRSKTCLDDETSDSNVNSDSSLSKISNRKVGRNCQYNIYTIGACGLSQNELMKNKIEKDYKILVRTKIDGIEKLENEMMGYVKLVPKLEHQTALGAEAVTIEEAAKEWISLTFTPNTYLIRVRIDQPTSECLQIEKRTTSSINNELNRLYNIKGDNILVLIYNIIKNMAQMSPGRYLLRHTPQNGAFAYLYKETDSPGNTTINLDGIYCENIFRTIINIPWPALDKMLPTPATKFFNRMPVMFYSRNESRSQGSKFKTQQKKLEATVAAKTKKKKKKSGQLKKMNCKKPELN